MKIKAAIDTVPIYHTGWTPNRWVSAPRWSLPTRWNMRWCSAQKIGLPTSLNIKHILTAIQTAHSWASILQKWKLMYTENLCTMLTATLLVQPQTRSHPSVLRWVSAWIDCAPYTAWTLTQKRKEQMIEKHSNLDESQEYHNRSQRSQWGAATPGCATLHVGCCKRKAIKTQPIPDKNFTSPLTAS